MGNIYDPSWDCCLQTLNASLVVDSATILVLVVDHVLQVFWISDLEMFVQQSLVMDSTACVLRQVF